MLTPPRAILFDWDETLVNSWKTILNSVNHTRQHYGLNIWSEEESHQNINRSMRDSFPEMFGDQWQEAAAIFRENILVTHLENLTPKPAAQELLEHLQSNNILLGLVSNKNGSILRKEINHLGWDNFFSGNFICGAEDGPHDKPHPECWSAMRGHFKEWTGKSIWYVGDKKIDMEFAENIGATAILLTDLKVNENAIQFDAHFKDCDELLKTIKKQDLKKIAIR